MTDTSISQSAPQAIAGSPLVGYAWDTYKDAPEHVIYLGLDPNNNTHVYELWYSPATGAWFYEDLTAATGTPNVLAGSGLAGFVWGYNPAEYVIYLGSDTNNDTHVYQLCHIQTGS